MFRDKRGLDRNRGAAETLIEIETETETETEREVFQVQLSHSIESPDLPVA